jgi:hypothetical protein
MTNDAEHLRLLSIFHYVVGGLSALCACFPFIHLAIGIGIVSGAFNELRKGSPGYDLRLMSTVNDVNGIPTEGKNLIIVAAVNRVLHFRIFDGDGKVVVDTDEKRLTEQARPIEDLRKQLESLWPPHVLTTSERGRLITAVTSIVGQTSSPPPEFIGWFFIVLATTFIIFGWIYAICMLAAGRLLWRRRGYTFCLAMAGLSCANMPLGTCLGVFTLVVLLRPSVKVLFEGEKSVPEGF